VADSAITIGVTLLAIEMLLDKHQIPSTKLQISANNQAPISIHLFIVIFVIGYYLLFGICNLEFGGMNASILLKYPHLIWRLDHRTDTHQTVRPDDRYRLSFLQFRAGWRAKKENIDPEHIVNLGVYVLLTAIVVRVSSMC